MHVQLVVEIVPFPCFGVTDVGGESLDAVTQGILCFLHCSLKFEDRRVVRALLVIEDRR